MRCVPLLRTPRDPLQSAPAEMVSAKDAGEQVIEPLVLCNLGPSAGKGFLRLVCLALW